MNPPEQAGARALDKYGGWRARKWLILRRASQLFFLLLFLTGPFFGVWISKGTLAQSMTLDILPLSDPFITLQEFASGHVPAATALIGAALVLGAYLVVGGRSYCGWVCPLNPVTDAAAWLRRKFGLRKGWTPKRETRLYMMAGVLIVSALTGALAWELVNPITSFHRALVFGAGFGLAAAAAIFLFDLFTARHGWCGHLCPVGAFYGLVGEAALLRVTADRRDACDDCMDCFAVCPEPHVISPALRGGKTGAGPLILSGDCLNCGRCIDVCSEGVFRFTHRFDAALRAPLQGEHA